MSGAAAASQDAASRWHEEVRWFRVVLALAVLAAAVVGVWALASRSVEPTGPGGLSRAAFTDATGIRLTRVALAGGGGIVDVRFQVIDPQKAQALHNPETPLTVVDGATAKALTRPFHFHSTSGRLLEGRTYYELLVNSDGLIRSGDRVSIQIGEFALANILAR